MLIMKKHLMLPKVKFRMLTIKNGFKIRLIKLNIFEHIFILNMNILNIIFNIYEYIEHIFITFAWTSKC